MAGVVLLRTADELAAGFGWSFLTDSLLKSFVVAPSFDDDDDDAGPFAAAGGAFAVFVHRGGRGDTLLLSLLPGPSPKPAGPHL